jgi:hypothetical protein
MTTIAQRSMALSGLLMVLISLSAVGCGGGSNELVLAPVEGRVTLKGSPVSGALVQFSPSKGPSSIGYTDENGAFTLQSNQRPGALPSTHSVKVTIGLPRPPELSPGGTENTPQEVPVAAKPPTDYVFNTTVTVESGQNSISLELSEAKKQQG